jgi:hypothetical protein
MSDIADIKIYVDAHLCYSYIHHMALAMYHSYSKHVIIVGRIPIFFRMTLNTVLKACQSAVMWAYNRIAQLLLSVMAIEVASEVTMTVEITVVVAANGRQRWLQGRRRRLR